MQISSWLQLPIVNFCENLPYSLTGSVAGDSPTRSAADALRIKVPQDVN